MLKQQFTFMCAVTSEAEEDILHIQVKSKIYQPECYYKHLTFSKLPSILQSVFNNISHLFVHINRPDMVYFDNLDSSIKICILVAGQVRQIPIKMQPKNRIDGLKYRIGLLRQQKAKNRDQFNKVKEEREVEIDQLKKIILKQFDEKQYLYRQIDGLAVKRMSVQAEICQVNLQIQHKINQYKQINQANQERQSRNQSVFSNQNNKMEEIHSQNISFQWQKLQLKASNQIKVNQLSENVKNDTILSLQEKKQFWIKQIRKIKNSKARALKQLIQSQTQFEDQKLVSIRGIQLKKMLFIQIFVNLQTIDLSNNHIRKIEGLTELKILKKLDLSLNLIENIKGLNNNTLLVELILHSNRIKVLQYIYHLINLRILSLSQNQLTVIPDKIGRMLSLVQLKLGNNNITEISEKVLKLKNLKIFTIVGNKCYSIKNKSKEIIDLLINRGIKTTE